MSADPEKTVRQEVRTLRDTLDRLELILDVVADEMGGGKNWESLQVNLHEFWRDAERLESAAKRAKMAALEKGGPTGFPEDEE